MDEAQMRRAIARKRDGEALDATTWNAIVHDVVSGTLDEAQVAALLMACVLRGLDANETHALTAAFIASGETLSAPDPRTLDKHSSGGVADTASLIVVPIVAAAGVPVAKLSGRALAHTGGTLEKLEAISGVRTDLDPEHFFAVVGQAGCAIAAQSARLVPADKRIYALRDRTATVPSQGLIAASIVAKKIAGGAHAIVYDVKAGDGAFLRDASAARTLAGALVSLTRAFGRRARALVTDMNEPLGPAIGTGLEAIEARDFLSGTRRDPRLDALCRRLGAAMLALADVPDGRDRIARVLADGSAFATFEKMLALQGARANALAELAPHRDATTVRADRSGFIARVATVELGELARDLVSQYGAAAGIRMHARVGAAVVPGAPLATVYGDATSAAAIADAFTIGEARPDVAPLVAYESD